MDRTVGGKSAAGKVVTTPEAEVCVVVPTHRRTDDRSLPVDRLLRFLQYRPSAFIRPARFGLVGLSGTVIDLTVLHVLMLWLPMTMARALAVWVAMTWNFAWNRAYTFPESRDSPIGIQYYSFCMSCLIGAICSWSTSVGLHWTFGPLGGSVVPWTLAGIALGAGTNYLMSKRFAFRDPQEMGVVTDYKVAERIRASGD